ncbi:magnesium transport protein CorA [Ktedonobacter sp. SOSP1-85]|uniref:magnesium/cobalt transporter CorA n=1 Tax=Ktedonobacter sp. SOSP1-85 TaxID=2778367 RepID=UPI001914F6BE|nr:magnesium/cobalt transporter CorA [Ktedonobacter sp. SOSP1-85]GHO77084.1 magnesium transport protein CorA [Ktedonobacter sp. SOSP1-85]
MIRGTYCDKKQQTFHSITDLNELSQFKDNDDIFLWVDLQDPTKEELAKLGVEFQLHPLALEDATHEHQRPKIEEYDNFYFVVFYAAHLETETGELDLREIDIFLNKHYLLTVHEKPIEDLKEIQLRWTRNVQQLHWGTGILLYSFLDTLVDDYFPVVDALVDQTEEIEDQLYLQQGQLRERDTALKLLTLRKKFLALRRVVTPQRDILNVLTNHDSSIFDERINIYFRDIYDHITRLADTVDLYRDQLSSTMDANLTVASNELNKVMRTMTAASIILMVDALIPGIYGMNFENIPELKWEYGYFAVLFLMLGLTIGLFLVFRRLRWF